MPLTFAIFGSIGIAIFSCSALSLLLTWGYMFFRITGHVPGSVGQDATAKKLAAVFWKLFLFSLAYLIAFIVVFRMMGLTY